MNQVLLTALQTSRNDRNIILLVQHMTPEDDIISALEEMVALAKDSKANREKAAAEQSTEVVEPEVV